MRTKIIMILMITVLVCSGCDWLKDVFNEEVRPPLPTATPIEVVVVYTPTPEPTPENPMWGYISGDALIYVDGLICDDQHDKSSIFHLKHPTTNAWLNIRYRADGKFQMKGALDSEYGCTNEINFYDMKNAMNGMWRVAWGSDIPGNKSWVKVESPNSETSELWFEGGIAAWRSIQPGSGDARIPAGYPCHVDIIDIMGIVGFATHCKE